MFKDVVKTKEINGVKIPKLKGEVVVRLFDEKTGKLEKEVHGENMVTDAVKDIFKSNYFGLLDYNSLMPISDELFGGVLCFRNELTESAKNYYPPTTDDNPVVAHAGQTTYSSASDDQTRGLPNDTSSGYIQNGKKNVWDFASTQGNGTISAIALTHKNTGDFWLNDDHFIAADLSSYTGGFTVGTSYSTKYPMCFHPVIRTGYNFAKTGSGEVTITEFKNFSPTEKVGLCQQKLISPSSNSFITAEHVISGLSFDPTRSRIIYDPSLRVKGVDEYDSLDHYEPDDLVSYMNVAYKCIAATPTPAGDFDSEKWEAVKGYAWLVYVNGTTLKTARIDLTGWTVSESSHTLSGINMAEFTQSKEPYMIMTDVDDDGNLYIQGNTATKAYRIKTGGSLVPSNVYEVTKSSRSSRVIIGCGHYGIGLGGNSTTIDGVTVCQGFIIEGNNSHDVSLPSYLDGTDWTTRYLSFYRPETNRSPIFYGTGEIRWVNNAEAPRTLLNKLFLSTIYNLSAPISKSATQTMQIIYQITEVT